MAFRLFETFAILLGLIGSMLFAGTIYKSKTQYGKYASVVLGVAFVVLSIFIWSRTDRDILQLAWCAVDKEAPACTPKSAPPAPTLVSGAPPPNAAPQASAPAYDGLILKFSSTDGGHGNFKLAPANPNHVFKQGLIWFTGFMETGYYPLESDEMDFSYPIMAFLKQDLRNCERIRTDEIKFFFVELPILITGEYISNGVTKEHSAIYKIRTRIPGSQASGDIVADIPNVVFDRALKPGENAKAAVTAEYDKAKQDVARACGFR